MAYNNNLNNTSIGLGVGNFFPAGLTLKGQVIGDNNVITPVMEYTYNPITMTYDYINFYTVDGATLVYGSENRITVHSGNTDINYIVGHNNSVTGNRNVLLNSDNIILTSSTANDVTLIGVKSTPNKLIEGQIKLGDSSQYVHIDSKNVSEGQYNSIINGLACHTQGHNNIIIEADQSNAFQIWDTILSGVNYIKLFGDTTSYFSVGDTILVEDYDAEPSELILTGVLYITGTNKTHLSADTINSQIINAVNSDKRPWVFNLTSATTQITGSTAIGFSNKVWGNYALAQGYNNIAIGDYSHAQGFNCIARGENSHAEGNETGTLGDYSHSEGTLTYALGLGSHSEGIFTQATGDYSHAEGEVTKAIGQSSHAEGRATYSTGTYSHSEGYETLASGFGSHSEGNETIASGSRSHAEGFLTIASGLASHSEGYKTIASGSYSHTQGNLTLASGFASHAGGQESKAIGNSSFNHSYNYWDGAGGAVGDLSAILGGSFSTVLGRSSVALGMESFTGTAANTVYVPKLNIQTVGTTTSIKNLGVDVNGNVVVGGAGGSGSTIPSDFSANSITANTFYGGTFYGDGSNLTGILKGDYLPISGGTLTGPVTGTSFTVNSLVSNDQSIVESTTNGTLMNGGRRFIQAYITSGGTAATLLENTSNWDINGNYIGTALTLTYQGQKHYNNNYFFEAVQDNIFIRLIRG